LHALCGFFETTKKSDPAPAVQINVGGPATAALDLSAITVMRERMAAIIDEVDFEALE
jgi:hypothetical protein